MIIYFFTRAMKQRIEDSSPFFLFFPRRVTFNMQAIAISAPDFKHMIWKFPERCLQSRLDLQSVRLAIV